MLTVVCLILFLSSNAMTEIIDFGLFPSYMLNYNMLCFEDRFVFFLQTCFFQNGSRYVVIIYTVIQSDLTTDGYSNWDISHSLYARNKQ